MGNKLREIVRIMQGLICEVACPSINSFNTYLLSVFYMLGTVFRYIGCWGK